MKLELLTNATVVDDAIRFVTSNTSPGNIHGTRILSQAERQVQEQEEEVKPKTEAFHLNYTGTDEDSDIQGPQEKTEYLPGDATTTNSVF
jgi:hypothetical protein